jgi:hypothetical protein
MTKSRQRGTYTKFFKIFRHFLFRRPSDIRGSRKTDVLRNSIKNPNLPVILHSLFNPRALAVRNSESKF